MPDAALSVAVLTKKRTNPTYVGARAGVDRVLAGASTNALALVANGDARPRPAAMIRVTLPHGRSTLGPT